PAALGERPADLPAQFLGHEGLGQVVEGALAERLHRVVDCAVRGHDEHGQARLTLMRLLHELEAAQGLQAQVEERHVEAAPIQKRNGVPIAPRERHVESHGLEPHLEDLEDARVVVHHKGATVRHRLTSVVSTADPASPGSRPSRGRRTVKVLPTPSCASTLTWPPWASTSPFTMAKPSPEPPRPWWACW